MISLTTTPMLCALFLRPKPPDASVASKPRRTFGDRVLAFYGRTLAWTLRHNALVLAGLAATIVLNVVLLTAIPKGFFPHPGYGADDRQPAGAIRASPSRR